LLALIATILSTAASSGEENSSASAISVEVWRTRQMLSAN
jgi:hypothetical protein